MTPEEAIQRYALSGDAEAFAALVRQYQQLVYAAASRRLSRREDIEDAAQQTFLGLARAAGSVPRDVAAWLYRAAQHAAIDVLRRNETRRRHESAAEPMQAAEAPDAAEWRERSLAIDEAIAALPPDERSLVVEHFLAGRSQRELAAAMNTSQPTVQRRLEAAVARLRERLAAHGGKGMLGATGLLTHLPTMGQASVPASTTAELAKIALALPARSATTTAAAAGTGVGTGVGVKATAAALLATAAVVGIAFFAGRDEAPVAPASPPPAPTPAAPPVPPPDPAAVAAALERLAGVYRLDDGQDVVLRQAPFPPERADYLAAAHARLAAFDVRLGFGVAADGRLAERASALLGNSRLLVEPIRDTLGLQWHEYDLRAVERLVVRRSPLDWAPAGDWLCREDIPAARRVAGLARVLSDWLGRDVRFVRDVERRPCLVFTGRPTLPTRRLAGMVAVAVSADPAERSALLDTWDTKGRERRERFHAADLSEWLDAPLFQPADAPLSTIGPVRFVVGRDVRWHDAKLGVAGVDRRAPGYRAHLVRIAAGLEEQLGGRWSVEDRDVERWTAVVDSTDPPREGPTAPP